MRIYFLALLFSISYLASSQKYEFSAPSMLGNQINSKAEDLYPILSPDGKTLYFARVLDPANYGGELGGMDIWISKKGKDGQWSQSSNKLNNWNNKYNNAVIGVNTDNTIVYLLNAYANHEGVAFSKLLNGSWTDPEVIHMPKRKANEFSGLYMTPSFDVLLISMNTKNSFGQEDLYVSVKDSLGEWNAPINLGPTINTEGFEISPFLSKDGGRLYFSSNGHKGLGSADIFYSDRLYNSWETWSTPINLGDKVNSPSFDSHFSIYGDSLAFFSSNRSSELADIFTAKTVLKSQAFDSERQYLTDSEINELIGNSVSGMIRFDQKSAVLNAAQNEFLFYIVNKVITKSDINIQLSVGENELQKIGEDRLAAVSDKLKILGISSYRIFQVAIQPGNNRTSDSGKVMITLFR